LWKAFAIMRQKNEAFFYLQRVLAVSLRTAAHFLHWAVLEITARCKPWHTQGVHCHLNHFVAKAPPLSRSIWTRKKPTHPPPFTHTLLHTRTRTHMHTHCKDSNDTYMLACGRSALNQFCQGSAGSMSAVRLQWLQPWLRQRSPWIRPSFLDCTWCCRHEQEEAGMRGRNAWTSGLCQRFQWVRFLP